jgi:hypothetical protein
MNDILTMKIAFIIVIAIFICFPNYAESKIPKKIEIVIIDLDNHKIDKNDFINGILPKEIKKIDITKNLFKIFGYLNEEKKQEYILLIKKDYQQEYYDLFNANLDSLVIFYFDEKYFSSAIIKEADVLIQIHEDKESKW